MADIYEMSVKRQSWLRYLEWLLLDIMEQVTLNIRTLITIINNPYALFYFFSVAYFVSLCSVRFYYFKLIIFIALLTLTFFVIVGSSEDVTYEKNKRIEVYVFL